jgi:hypothetical protein
MGASHGIRASVTAGCCLFILLPAIAFASHLVASTDFQSWNELDVQARINPFLDVTPSYYLIASRTAMGAWAHSVHTGSTASA